MSHWCSSVHPLLVVFLRTPIFGLLCPLFFLILPIMFVYWLFLNTAYGKLSLMHLKYIFVKSYANPTLVASILFLGTGRTTGLHAELRPYTAVISTTHQEKGPFNQSKIILYKYFLMTNGKNTYINTKMPSQHSYLWNHEFTSSTQLAKLAAITW